jgi:putative adhesin
MHLVVRSAFVAIAVALLPGAGPLAQSSTPFRWEGNVTAGNTLEIKGVNGKISAAAAAGAQAEVVAEKSARRSDPDSVKIQVVEHGGGVTVCAMYPTPDEAERANECAPGDEGHMQVRDNDVTVKFTVRVPAGVRFVGRTVNGEVTAERLDGPVTLRTVNGSATFSTSSFGEATTVNGSIRADLGRADWTDTLKFTTVNGGITLTLPAGLSTDVTARTVNGDIATDFPLTIVGRFSRRSLDGSIGGGGRGLDLRTVNGGIALRQR